jgi:predicted enzyme related to lactoylglutathione lyase
VALTIRHITVDCGDALAVATFWAAALDLPLDGGDAENASIGRDVDGRGWLFFQVPEGKSAKNRMRVDLESEDRAADVARLLGLGASIVDEHDEWKTRWTVLQDPEGNEFCVVQA